jgi:hypothetical protein
MVVQWESGVASLIGTDVGYPETGESYRWRTRSGPFRVLHDRPQEVEAERRLRSLLAAGPFRYDETYELAASEAGCRLRVRMRAWTALPVLGPLIDREYLGPATRREFAAALASIKRLCEGRAYP